MSLPSLSAARHAHPVVYRAPGTCNKYKYCHTLRAALPSTSWKPYSETWPLVMPYVSSGVFARPRPPPAGVALAPRAGRLVRGGAPAAAVAPRGRGGGDVLVTLQPPLRRATR